MFKRKGKKVYYEILIPPTDIDFENSDKKEIDKYFNWFVGSIPDRVSYLRKQCSNDLNISIEEIDLSSDSLLIIWTWFLKVVKIGKTSKCDLKYIKSIIKHLPKVYQSKILDESYLEFSIINEYMIRDIGMYLGEVFKKVSDKVYWTYYIEPKNDMYVNKPVLKGFVDNSVSFNYEPSFEPINIVRTQASKVMDNEENEKDLLRIYNTWVKYL